jgi:hypothetical protein
MNEVRANAGSQFCTTVIDALEAIYREEPEVLRDGGAQSRALPAGLNRRRREQAQAFEAVADKRDLVLARLNKG